MGWTAAPPFIIPPVLGFQDWFTRAATADSARTQHLSVNDTMLACKGLCSPFDGYAVLHYHYSIMMEELMGGLPSRAYTTNRAYRPFRYKPGYPVSNGPFAYFGPFISLTWPLWILYLGRSLDDQLRFTLSRCHNPTCFRPNPQYQ